MTWAAIIAVLAPILLAFVAGLVKTADSNTLEDGPGKPGKEAELTDALAKWKKENGVP